MLKAIDYFGNKEFAKAAEHFTKHLKLCKDDEEKFLINESISICYYNMKEGKKCMKILDKMKKLMKSDNEKYKVYLSLGKCEYLLVYI